MCVEIYLAADRSLPVVPWTDDAPAFHVRQAEAEEEVVHPYFTMRHLYAVGGHEKCGCCLSVNPKDPELDVWLRGKEASGGEDGWFTPVVENFEKDMASRAKSMPDFVAYLRKAAKQGPLEAYATWNRTKPPHSRRAMPAEAIDEETFYLREEEFVTILRAAGKEGE